MLLQRKGERTTTGILGGGLTGLTLGTMIRNSEILEKEEVVGGLCRSKVIEGFTYDIGGSHVLFSRNKDTMNYVKRTLGNNVERRIRNTKIFFKGRFVKYPFENGLSELPPEENLECLVGYMESYYARKNRKARKPRNFKEWMYYRFGNGITDKYLLPYNEKIWKIKASKMSLDWIAGRIPDPPIKDVLRSSLGITTEGYTHQLHFLYPRMGGIQSLTDAIARKCKSVMPGIEIKEIRKEDNSFVVSDGRSEKSYQRLISTIPLPTLIKCLKDVPGRVKKSARSLRSNSLISVFLGLYVHKTKDFSWAYFPEKKSQFHRVSFPSNYSPRVAPKGHSSILAEITCNKGDRVWLTSDDELTRNTIDRLAELKIIRKKDVAVSDVARMTPAYVIYDTGYKKNIRTVGEFVRKQGIETSGRFGLFEYLNMDACIERAMEMAKKPK